MATEQEQVNAAADALAARGVRVTNSSVRDEMGGGSFSVLAPMVRIWKERHVAEAAAAEELPEEAKQAGEAAARTIWAAARSDTAQRIEFIQANADQRVYDAETETAEAMAEVQRLEKTAESREGEIQTLEQSLVGTRASRDESAATVQARDATIDSLRDQLTEQRETAAAASEKLDGLREQLVSEKSRAESARQDLDAERKAHAETRQAVDAQRSRADRTEERLESANASLKAMTAERDALRTEAKDAVREWEKARATADARSEQIEQLRGDLEAARKRKAKPEGD